MLGSDQHFVNALARKYIRSLWKLMTPRYDSEFIDEEPVLWNYLIRFHSEYFTIFSTLKMISLCLKVTLILLNYPENK